MMSKIIVMLAFAFATLASSAHAEYKWQHFGADPYAVSRDAAMKTREIAFAKLGLPAEVVAAAMQATAKPGEPTKLTNGDRLGAMISKGSIVHKDVLVDFKKPPQSGMEFVARAEKWTVTSGGKIYTVFLPEVCWNWSVTTVQAPAAQQTTAPAPVVGACPNGYTIIANAWSLQSLGGLRKEAEELVAAANARESDEGRSLAAYQPSSVSRTLGARLRTDVKVRAQVSGDALQVRYLDPQTANVVRELGTMTLTQGVGTFRFSDDPREYVVETVWPREFVSPTMSGGERRLRIFPNEWRKFCSMNAHGISLP